MLRLVIEFYLTLLPPLVYFLGLMIISSSVQAVSQIKAIIGLSVIIIGLILWLTSYLNLRSSLTVLPKAKKLVTTGPYQYFSHPMYLAIVLVCLGLCLATGSITGFLYTIFIIVPLNILRIKKEEKVLLKKFGQKYREYKQKRLF